MGKIDKPGKKWADTWFRLTKYNSAIRKICQAHDKKEITSNAMYMKIIILLADENQTLRNKIIEYMCADEIRKVNDGMD